uniref:Class I SAM-dependent methyltransferase n=1 Tax=Roseihalotalea indica TaxID=2867963 RepID=A0AA49GM83_9BACT|nr:class I SAM-dependent methyltransferase [Tunicatimonas sp. TK19036]WKN40044.1 class I SAM-dependent methyltransferase [Tunicatimonas sp. TK19036]
MKWYRQDSLAPTQTPQSQETWIRTQGEQQQAFPMQTYLGKKTNLLKLKKNVVENITQQLAYFQQSRTEVYNQPDKAPVEACPVCGTSSEKTQHQVTIYGAEYVTCQHCTHAYVINRPSPNAIHEFYLSDVNYAATYTDKKSAESRLNAIAVPWCDWMVKVYQQVHGRAPKKILDVGSGAGHFVEACRRAGMQAEGIELSEASRKFSKDIWGIDMDGRDFTQVDQDYAGYDVITFWGLLEHTPNPKDLLAAAQRIFKTSDAGMIIAKLPRWHSLSGFIQNICNETIVRHLDPMGHISCYTDASAAELYVQSGFHPVAAWYYGMDVYELFMQVSHQLKQYDTLLETGELQTELQQKLDEVKLSDGLTLVGVPQQHAKQ